MIDCTKYQPICNHFSPYFDQKFWVWRKRKCHYILRVIVSYADGRDIVLFQIAGELPGMMTVNASDIATHLRQQISSGRFAAQDRLPPERVLAEQYGVARGTVRQALRQLEQSQFVERRPGSGTYVTFSDGEAERPISEITRPRELVDARFAVEPQMCRLAVLHATAAELDSLRAHFERMEGCEHDSATFADVDEEFHMAIARCTQNPMILWMMRQIHETRSHAQWGRMRELTLNPEIIRVYNQQHRQIIDSIAQRDPEGAADAMKKHLATARQTLVGLAD